MATSLSSYWCYRCNRFFRILNRNSNGNGVICPACDSGFIEEVEIPTRRSSSHRFPAAAVYMLGGSHGVSDLNAIFHFRQSRRNAGRHLRFNPVIVLRNPGNSGVTDSHGGGEGGRFDLYYDAGAGLRPLPARISELLLGSGFDRLLEHLSQIELNGTRRWEAPPASKRAVESMPTIVIAPNHVVTDWHRAVCKEPFKLGSEVREMPCKHIYHSDCILPWLYLRNSCPVCRHELTTDAPDRNSPEFDTSPDVQSLANAEEETVGMTIWRLPTGGFAVGRFSSSRQSGERELPVVYTEMDGGFNTGGTPRRISWSSRGSQWSGTCGIGRLLSNFLSFFGWLRFPSGSSRRNQLTGTGLIRSSQEQAGISTLEDGNGISR